MKLEKSLFTLSEVAELLNCTADEVLHYGAEHGLGLVTHIHRAALKELICRVSDGEIVAYGPNRGEPVHASGNYFRIKAEDIRAIEFDKSVIPETIYLADSVSGAKIDGMLVYQIESGAKEITADHLRVLSSELDRWEQARGLPVDQVDINVTSPAVENHKPKNQTFSEMGKEGNKARLEIIQEHKPWFLKQLQTQIDLNPDYAKSNKLAREVRVLLAKFKRYFKDEIPPIESTVRSWLDEKWKESKNNSI